MGAKVRVKVLPNGVSEWLPEYMSEAASGADLRAAIEGEVTLAPMQRALIPTGIALSIPKGYEGQVRPRSGLAIKHGITLLNSPGTIDSDYRGEVKVILVNLGSEEFVLKRGERVAQLVVAEVQRAEFTEEADLDGTSRGSGGFGHTGK